MRLSLRRRSHVLLVLLLVAMLAIYPLVERVAAGRAAVDFAIVTSIVVVLYRVGASRRGLLLLAVLGALAVAGQALHLTALPGPPGFASALAQTLFYAGAAFLMCVYMLIALLIARLARFASRGAARPDRLRPRDPLSGSR